MLSAPRRLDITDSMVTYFTFQQEVLQSVVVKAELGVYIKRPTTYSTRKTLVLIERLHRRGTENVSRKRIRLDADHTGRWYTFDLTKVVMKWIKNPQKNLGVRIVATDDDGRGIAIVTPENEEEEAYVSTFQWLSDTLVDPVLQTISRAKAFCKSINKYVVCNALPCFVCYSALFPSNPLLTAFQINFFAAASVYFTYNVYIFLPSICVIFANMADMNDA